jgi:histidyl-tRNA synthetase
MGVDAEVCAILSEALEAVGIDPGDYEVRVNNRKVLSGLLQRCGVADPDKQLEVLRHIDKLDRLGLDGVAALLGEGRLDASGAYTDGAKLDDAQTELVMAFVEAGDPSRDKVLDTLADLVSGNETGEQGVAEMAAINELLRAMGPMPQVVFEPTVVRGLAYYTGPVFEAALTFEVLDDDGQKRSFGSVAGGGRYDDLVKRFTGEDVPACGASIGVDRLLAALRAQRRAQSVATGPVVVTVMDRDHLADYQAMVTSLRQAGIAAELYLGEAGFQKQLRYADKRQSPVAIIAGGNEFADGSVVVKDLILGAARAKEIIDRDEWRNDQSAQQTVPLADLVTTVRAVLDRT